MVERIRRVDYETLEDNIALDDPKAYIESLATKRILRLKPNWNIMEFICEDNSTFLDFKKRTGEEKK